MMTQSHFLITAFCGDLIRRRRPVHMKGFLLGSVLPDIPLIILTLGYFLYRKLYLPFQLGDPLYGSTYDTLYFHNPYWIISTSLFHAPLIILLMAGIGYRDRHLPGGWRLALYWFAIGCGLHSFIDIFTHHNDGPLLLFPLNWDYRLPTPISYWDPAHYGRLVGGAEKLVDFAIVIYFLSLWVLHKVRPKQLNSGP